MAGDRAQFQVVLTGAFSTGAPLRVRLAEYASFQDEVGERLERHASGGWNREGVKWRGVSSYGQGAGGYANLVPLVLVQREGAPLREAAARHGDGAPHPFGDGREWGWTLAELTIQLYDLGVGVIAGVYDVTAPAGVEVGAAADAVYAATELDRERERGGAGLSPLAAAYEAVARESVDAFREAVPERAREELQEPWLAARAEGADGWPDGEVEPGRLLWLHPVYVARGAREAGVAELARIASPFESTYSRQVEYPDGLFVPGLQKTAIVTRGGFELKREPLGMVVLNWAYYALFMEMDRGLLASLDADRWGEHASLRALERDAESTYRAFFRFREAKARLDSALTGLGPRQTNLWAPIADVNRFDELLAGVEGKLEVLQSVAEGRVQSASARSSRRSRNALTALTALTLVTVVVALFDSIAGSRAPDRLGHVELRVGFAVAALLIALVVYLLAERELGWLQRWRSGSGGRRD